MKLSSCHHINARDEKPYTFGREDLSRHYSFISKQYYLLAKKKSQRAEHLPVLWFPDQLSTYVKDMSLLTVGKPEWRCLEGEIGGQRVVEQQPPCNASELNSNVLSTDDQPTTTPGAKIFLMSSMMKGQHLNQDIMVKSQPNFRIAGNPKFKNI